MENKYIIKIEPSQNNNNTLKEMNNLANLIKAIIKKVKNKFNNNFLINITENINNCKHIIVLYPAHKAAFCPLCNEEFLVFNSIDEMQIHFQKSSFD